MKLIKVLFAVITTFSAIRSPFILSFIQNLVLTSSIGKSTEYLKILYYAINLNKCTETAVSENSLKYEHIGA